MDKTTELLNERQKTHGDFDDFASCSQTLKTVIASHNPDFTHRQREAVEMICNKLARLTTGNPDFEDHWDDIAGYARLGKEGHKPDFTSEICETAAGITIREAYEDMERNR